MDCTSFEIFGLSFLIFVILTVSSMARYYTKMTVFMLSSVLLATFLPIPFFILRPRDYRNALMPAWGCRLVLRLLGASFEVRGLENINKRKGAVVLINHQSAIDLVVLAYLWPIIGRATVVSKKELLYFFPFGTASYLWGTLFIDRANRSDAMSKLNKESDAITKDSSKLLFFPEGTRHQGDKLLPFKKGPFHIAVQSQCSIQPVVVSKYLFLDSKRKTFDRGHNVIEILPEISCNGLTKDDISTLMVQTQTNMQTKFTELTEEMKLQYNYTSKSKLT